MNRSQRAKNNRTKGHDAERYYAQIFRDLGFEFCKTAREGSRLYDNAKIDLINLPFNLQIKAGVQKNMNPGKELFSMINMIKVLFPPDNSVHLYPCFLVHKKPIGRGRKPTPQHEVVYMSNRQFQEYKKDIPSLSMLSEKIFKFEMDSEFKHIVAITFESFKGLLIKFFINDKNNSERES